MTTTTAPRDALTEAAERFPRDTATHQLTILHDDGVYRHLRFRRPDTGMYWFDLVTWPGHLAYTGDVSPGHVFSRVPDMFEFFRDGSRYGINPDYWAEKLVTERNVTKEYREELVRQQVAEELDAWAEHLSTNDLGRLRAAVQEELLEDLDNLLGWQETAVRALCEFTFDRRDDTPGKIWPFQEAYEWTVTDWAWSYLWCCHAIVWGIGQYDAARRQEQA